ncbi:MAG TPA: heparan-alpha-glucosaminide N-acetyltransferase domain-containing protein [Lacunisphaera sp.]|nr:heparan-alpha-glucosaminide N-acetyltransferase domain-containing protein [Lacunisphaera sp.]
MPAAPVAATSPAPRLESVDLLRGVVMIVMALDHTRDYFHFGTLHGLDPLDLDRTSVPLFLTRWITHYCAPIFSFLAGTGVFLAMTRGKSKAEMSRFLVTRGLWLVFLELTYVKWAWTFSVDPHFFIGAVIWVLGWSMIVLAALIHLPLRGIAAFGLGMIFLHNSLDGLRPADFGTWSGVWKVLHVRGPVALTPTITLRAGYSLIPWIGVMATGYVFGAIYRWDAAKRRAWLVRVGLACVVLFVVLRTTNVYGNLLPRAPQPTALRSILAALDCTKYPPSLSYLLMTLGPGLLLLAWFERGTPGWLRPALVFGRVPFLYYMLHLPLIHGLAWAWFRWHHGRADFLGFLAEGTPPADAGFSLPATYLVWAGVIVALYPVCRWFAEYKRRHRDVAWLSYF